MSTHFLTIKFGAHFYGKNAVSPIFISCLFFTLDQYRGEHAAEVDIFGNGIQTLGVVLLNLKCCQKRYIEAPFLISGPFIWWIVMNVNHIQCVW